MDEERAATVLEMPGLLKVRRNGTSAKECGNCRLCLGDGSNLTIGYCHANPPIMAGLHPQHGPQFCRPVVRLTDPGCRFWEPGSPYAGRGAP